MFQANTKDILSLLLSMRYGYQNDFHADYSQQPRPCHNLVFLIEGEAVLTTEKTTFRLRAGDCLFIPQNTTYSCLWLAKPIVAFHSLHFSFQPRFDPFFNMRLHIQTLPQEIVAQLYEKVLRIKETQYEKNERSFFTLAEFFDICGLFLPHIQVEENAVNNTVAPALAYIERHYRRKISVETLAELCFLSPSRFHFVFKQQTGVSPIIYKNRVAVQYASQELLASPDTPVAEIARKHGFVSVIYFERLFKKITGKSPSQYRREFRLS